MADCIGKHPEGQRVSDKELAVLEDFISCIEGDVCFKCHRVLVDNFVHDLVKVLPPRFPLPQLFNCIKLEDDPDWTVCK